MQKRESFSWHPAARAFDGTGDEIPRTATFQPLIPDRPAGAALATALAGGGRPFRIGGEGAAPDPGPDLDPGCETLTGGTTGAPRRIRRSQQSWIASFSVNARLFGLGPGTHSAILGRLVHSLALYGALESLHRGATLHLLDRLRPDRQRAALAERAITHLYATPAQLRFLTSAPGPALPLRHLLIGGSKLDPALRAEITRLAPKAQIHEFYGAAEASFITLADATTPASSVGRPYPGVTLQIRDPKGTPLPEGETGEIWLQSPYLFTRYAGSPGTARWQDGWLSIEEHGRLEAGALFLAGRASRMVKVADQAVYPEAIESFLLARPDITQAAVFPRPDPLRGQTLVALVQGPAADAELLTALRHAFGPLAAPKQILRIADWPQLPSGKPDLAALARRLR